MVIHILHQKRSGKFDVVWQSSSYIHIIQILDTFLAIHLNITSQQFLKRGLIREIQFENLQVTEQKAEIYKNYLSIFYMDQ